jgi:hypothetical protein
LNNSGVFRPDTSLPIVAVAPLRRLTAPRGEIPPEFLQRIYETGH